MLEEIIVILSYLGGLLLCIFQTKTLAGLFTKEKWFLALSVINILAAVGLTLYRLIVVARDDPQNSDFTFTLLIIINAGITGLDKQNFSA